MFSKIYVHFFTFTCIQCIKHLYLKPLHKHLWHSSFQLARLEKHSLNVLPKDICKALVLVAFTLPRDERGGRWASIGCIIFTPSLRELTHKFSSFRVIQKLIYFKTIVTTISIIDAILHYT